MKVPSTATVHGIDVLVQMDGSVREFGWENHGQDGDIPCEVAVVDSSSHGQGHTPRKQWAFPLLVFVFGAENTR